MSDSTCLLREAISCIDNAGACFPFENLPQKGFMKPAGTTANQPQQQVGGSRITRLAIIIPSAAFLRRVDYPASDMTDDL